MDNLTHTLTAVAIGQTGLNRRTRFATLTLVLAANAPDLDIVTRAQSSLNYLHYHRGISHSLVGVTVIAVAVWAVVYGLGKRVRPKAGLPVNPGWLLLAALLGTGSHLLLDFTNAYGVRPFLPFSGRWYAWDIMPIIDPPLLALLIFGLGVPWLLRMISEEVGARKPRLVRGAVITLCAMGALWGIRDFAHRRALAILDSRTFASEATQRSGAFPVAASPFTWTGVVESATSFHVVRVNALDADADLEELAALAKPQPSPALAAATQSPAGKILLDFARFPWAQVNETDDAYQVSIEDLRFFHPSSPTRSFILEIELDRNLRPRFEAFHFVAPGR
jgi:inner membrane protein